MSLTGVTYRSLEEGLLTEVWGTLGQVHTEGKFLSPATNFLKVLGIFLQR